MDSLLVNDLALAFQLVSKKEKELNPKLLRITKRLVDIVLKLKCLVAKNEKASNER